ncbi:MAG: chorismate mutase [Acetobacteraceae bacterium]|jgi:chorismate mutase / prephenate dehydratase
MPSSARLDAPSAPAPVAEEPPPQDGWPGGLAALRAELDRIDDALHTLLKQRAAVVEQVARSGKRSAYRPGREAAMIRRLLRQHSGTLPAQAIVRIWRELLAGTTAMQAPFAVAVYESDNGAGFTQAAREHFGGLTPLHAYGRPALALADVSRGDTAVAVLPMPSETDKPHEAWWTALLRKDAARLYVVARLPFWAARPEGSPAVQALVVAATEPDASGHDRSLLGLDLDRDVGRARLIDTLTSAGLAPSKVVLRREPGAPIAQALVEVDGFLSDDDARLDALERVLRRPMIVGAYAIPETGAAA